MLQVAILDQMNKGQKSLEKLLSWASQHHGIPEEVVTDLVTLLRHELEEHAQNPSFLEPPQIEDLYEQISIIVVRSSVHRQHENWKKLAMHFELPLEAIKTLAFAQRENLLPKNTYTSLGKYLVGMQCFREQFGSDSMYYAKLLDEESYISSFRAMKEYRFLRDEPKRRRLEEITGFDNHCLFKTGFSWWMEDNWPKFLERNHRYDPATALKGDETVLAWLTSNNANYQGEFNLATESGKPMRCNEFHSHKNPLGMARNPLLEVMLDFLEMWINSRSEQILKVRPYRKENQIELGSMTCIRQIEGGTDTVSFDEVKEQMGVVDGHSMFLPVVCFIYDQYKTLLGPFDLPIQDPEKATFTLLSINLRLR